MAIKYYRQEYNAIRRINSAIARTFDRYGRYTHEYQNVLKAIVQEFEALANIYAPYFIDKDGLIQIKNNAIVREQVSGTDILRDIEKFKPSLKAMKEKYSNVQQAIFDYFSSATFSTLYSFIEENPFLTDQQKDDAFTLMHAYGSEWNKGKKMDTFVDVLKAAMTDPDIDVERVLQQLGTINYEDTPPEGTGFSYSGRLGM